MKRSRKWNWNKTDKKIREKSDRENPIYLVQEIELEKQMENEQK